MIGISIVLIIAGALICIIGATKATKSKFRDLSAITWCFVGNSIGMIGTLLAKYI